MRLTEITSCYLGPAISPEQFIAEHFFLYLAQGTMMGYDGQQYHRLTAGQCCLVRKNHLARYTKQKDSGRFEKVVVVFDEAFLKSFQAKYRSKVSKVAPQEGAFVLLKENELIPSFIRSLLPYYNQGGEINDPFFTVKREELLFILLQNDPQLADILFDFGAPEKIDLAAYMSRNYKFSISVERFAYLTGRSLSAFKRDFYALFSETPSRWLTRRRLQEAHFLLEKEGQRPSDIYLDLGFENLSHFSVAFKKQYGLNPRQLTISSH